MNRGLKPNDERIHINLCRLKKNGRNFELVVDPDKVVLYKQGLLSDVLELFSARQIFENTKKGILSPKMDLENAFSGMSEEEIFKYIIEHGELQLSSSYRKQLNDLKRKKIIELIHRNAINPETNLPHPLTRIENAFEEARITVEDKKDAEDQINSIVKKLQVIMPIKFEFKILFMHLPSKYAKKEIITIEKYGRILKNEVLHDGAHILSVEVPAGIYLELIDLLNARTKGSVDIKITN